MISTEEKLKIWVLDKLRLEGLDWSILSVDVREASADYVRVIVKASDGLPPTETCKEYFVARSELRRELKEIM